jgi:hypothetical protein
MLNYIQFHLYYTIELLLFCLCNISLFDHFAQSKIEII